MVPCQWGGDLGVTPKAFAARHTAMWPWGKQSPPPHPGQPPQEDTVGVASGAERC